MSCARKTNVRYAAACFPFAQALLGLFADVSKDTAIYIEDVSVDCIGCLRSKEYSGTGQLFGLQPSVSRGLSADELVERMSAAIGLDLTKRSCLRSLDVTGSKAVTLNVVLAVLGADVLGQHL